MAARELGGGPRHHRRALPPDSRGGRQPGVPRLRGDRQLVDAVDRGAGALLGLVEPLRGRDADHLAALLRLRQLGVQRDLRRRPVGVPRRVGAQPLLPRLGQQPRGVEPGLREEPFPGAGGARGAADDHRPAAERDGGPLGPLDPDPAGDGRGVRPRHDQGAARRGAVRRGVRPALHQRPVPGAARRARLRPRGGIAHLAGRGEDAARRPARPAAVDQWRQRPRQLRRLGRARGTTGARRHPGRAAGPARQLHHRRRPLPAGPRVGARHRRALHARGRAPHHRRPARLDRGADARVRGRQARRHHPEHGRRAAHRPRHPHRHQPPLPRLAHRQHPRAGAAASTTTAAT